MRWHPYKISREPGFRLNMIDIMVLSIVCLLSWLGREAFSDHYLYLIPVYVGISFFLFCNVIRIGNRLEPIWYIPFIALTLYGLTRPELYWVLVLGVCEPLRVGLVIYRLRQGNYVGAFYRQLGGLSNKHVFNSKDGLRQEKVRR